jgi:predicted phage baseplate assembly protein
MLRQDPRRAVPQIALMESALEWHARPDLLASAGTERVYCVEVDDDGVAHLRFGDNTAGLAPSANGANAYERTKKGYPDRDQAPVSAGGELQLVIGEDRIPIRLAPSENNLDGLRRAIEGTGANVTTSIWKRRGHDNPYVLYVSVDRIGKTLLQLIDHPNRAGENLLTEDHQGQDAPVFRATYRVGNGPAGNVGYEAISGIVVRSGLSGIELAPRNPLPATGGAAPEPLPEAKLRIPAAFRKELQRAITADDYARLAERHPKVQRAAATLHWTGRGYVAKVAVDPLGSAAASADLLREVARSLYRYRRIGHQVDVVPAGYVPLYLELRICVDPGYSGGHVKAALLDAFGNGVGPDGVRGFFHPDNLSFGDSVHVSRIVAATVAVPGVESVKVTKLERLFEGDAGEIENGVLSIGPLEVARLDNDLSRPENGVLHLDLGGGR